MSNTRFWKIGKLIGGILCALVTLILIFLFLTMPKRSERQLWQTIGYGLIMDISALTIDVNEVTEISCSRFMRVPASKWLLREVDGFEFSAADNVLTVTGGGLEPILAESIASLPATCRTGENDAETNYDIFWQTFNEHYAFFDLYGVDWDERYAAIRPQVTASTSDDELFDLMMQSLNGLNDGHIALVVDNDTIFSPADGVDWAENEDVFREVYRTYVKGDLFDHPEAEAAYGWLTDDVGYIVLHSMSPDTSFGVSAIDQIDEIMHDAALEFADATSIVIDVRFNPGGFDAYSIAIAELFVSQHTYVFSKSTRTNSGYTDPFDVYLRPKKEAIFTQPVFLLTSGATGSSAEIFTLSMRALPQVTVVGTPTSGGLSDALERTLPNGWFFTLSNQKYFAADGNVYEGVGIPVDVNVAFDANSLQAGQDTQLETVIELAEQNR